jgi:anti-sigma B factor antagonist
MEHAVREEDGAVIVAFSGDVDLHASPDARRVLLAAVERGRKVLVDLSEVTYLDSSGVASLIEALKRARDGGLGFGLVSVPDRPLRVLKLASLDRVFTIHETLASGLADGV